MPLFPPSSRGLPSFLSGKTLQFDATEYTAESFIGFKDFEVVHTIAAGEVEEDKGEDDLLVRPSLSFYVEMPFNDLPQIEERSKIQIDGKTCKGGHASIGFLLFILVRKESLWHNRFTSLVIDLVDYLYSIMLISQHQRGF